MKKQAPATDVMDNLDSPADKKSAAMVRYIGEIDRFATMLRQQQAEIDRLTQVQDDAKEAFDKARRAVTEAKDFEHETVALFLKFVRPGSVEILPLFDTMEPSSDKTHGAHSTEWRKEPITSLNLSALAMRALIAADIVLVGQLQDRVLSGPQWAADLAEKGVTDGIAQAIEAKLSAFIEERTSKK